MDDEGGRGAKALRPAPAKALVGGQRGMATAGLGGQREDRGRT